MHSLNISKRYENLFLKEATQPNLDHLHDHVFKAVPLSEVMIFAPLSEVPKATGGSILFFKENVY